MAVRKNPVRGKTRGRQTTAPRPRPGRTAAPPRRGLPWGARNDQSRVGVRELRQNLSVYLDRVKAGEALTVTEHGHIVAVLTPASHALSPLERLVAEGRATPATRSVRDLLPPRDAKTGAPSTEERLAAARRGPVP